MSKDFNNLGIWLPPRIEKTGLSIEMFARKVSLSRAQLYRYFTDLSRPTTQTMARICRALHVPLEEGLRQYTEKTNGRPKGSGGGTREVSVRKK